MISMKSWINLINIGKLVIFTILFIYILTIFNGIDKFWISSDGTRVETIEAAIRKAAVQCYALEGSYPPNIEYLEKNYGITIDKSRYYYYYNIFASNIMPEIGVYDKNQKKGVAVDVQ
jgi:hypothetical protein